MPFTPSYLELCVKLYLGQENSIKHLPGKYVTSDLRLHSDTFTVNVAIRCVSRISTLSSMFIQYWMNTSDKVDILYVNTVCTLKKDGKHNLLTIFSFREQKQNGT